MQISLKEWFHPSGIHPEVTLLDHEELYFFKKFLGTSIMFSIVATAVYTPINMHNCSFFSTSLAALISWLFGNSYSNRWGDTSLWFWFVFTWWLVMLNTFLSTSWPFELLLWKNVYLGLLPILKVGLDVFLLLPCMSSLHILDTNSLLDVWFANTFIQ